MEKKRRTLSPCRSLVVSTGTWMCALVALTSATLALAESRCANQVLDTIPSPDGRFKAVVFLRALQSANEIQHPGIDPQEKPTSDQRGRECIHVRWQLRPVARRPRWAESGCNLGGEGPAGHLLPVGSRGLRSEDCAKTNSSAVRAKGCRPVVFQN